VSLGRRLKTTTAPPWLLGVLRSWAILYSPSPAEELSATVRVVLVLVAGSECVPGSWPRSRRRAGSGPAPSRGLG
jgi:hypothetical protein